MTHTKSSFIKHHFNPLRLKEDQFPSALLHLEKAWDFLSANGYGAPKAHEPRAAGTDWYAKLSPEQRAAFDRFWKAYGYKKDKAGAAMRWGQIDPDAATAARIIEAAALENRDWGGHEQRDGIARKYAQGWLNERRWEDRDALTPTLSPGERGPDTLVKRANQLNELAALRQLHAARPNDALARQIEALEAKLRG